MSRNVQLAIVAACVILAFVYGLRRASHNRDDQKLREVQMAAWSLPVSPDFSSVSPGLAPATPLPV